MTEKEITQLVIERLSGKEIKRLFWINPQKCSPDELKDLASFSIGTIVKVIGYNKLDKTAYINNHDNPFTTGGYRLKSIDALKALSDNFLKGLDQYGI